MYHGNPYLPSEFLASEHGQQPQLSHTQQLYESSPLKCYQTHNDKSIAKKHPLQCSTNTEASRSRLKLLLMSKKKKKSIETVT